MDAGDDLTSHGGRIVLCFSAYGVEFRIGCDDLDLIRRVLPYGAREIGQASASARTYAMLREGEGWQVSGPDMPAAALPLDGAMRRLEDELYRAVMIHANPFVMLHGGAVAWQGRAIIFPGSSMSGKTTLTRAFLEAGAAVFSDDLVVLDEQGRVHPHPRRLQLRNERRRASIEELGGTVSAAALPVRLVLLTWFEEGAQWRPQPVSQGPGMLAALAHTPCVRLRPRTALATLARATEHAQFLEGPRGDADSTVHAVLAGMPLHHGVPWTAD